MRSLTILFAMLLMAYCSISQNYSNHNNLQSLQVYVINNEFGAGVSSIDFNQDGFDDLTFVTDDQILTYENINGNFQPIDFGFSIVSEGKHPIWVDYDNDSDLDFFVSQRHQPLQLYRNNGNNQFEQVAQEIGLTDMIGSTFGCSWGDMDRDGDLDLFVCNYIFSYQNEDDYHLQNHLFENNGDGTFSDVTLTSNTSDGISLSFQSSWMDYDNDLWPDLYVINDKSHPNRLYHNNRNGTFSEIGLESGTAVAPMDAMTTTLGDFNNDGFEDIFVTNTSIGDCALLKNMGDGQFIDIAPNANVALQMLTWGGNWMDYDLDMDLDLTVCEANYNYPNMANPFLVNNGNEIFSNQSSAVFPFDNGNSYSSATADFNHDGYPDLVVNNEYPQNANLWISNGSNNHFLKIKLEGLASNSKGIGSRIELWTDGILQSKYTSCGGNYLGQNSNTQLFGLGNNTIVDSLYIHWPSGHIDSFFDISSDQTLQLIEGSSVEVIADFPLGMNFCPGDSIFINVEGYDSYLWDNGSSESSIWVNDSSMVSLTVWNEFNVPIQTFWNISPTSLPAFDLEVIQPSCSYLENGSINITVYDQSAIVLWEDTSAIGNISNLSDGQYSFEIVDQNGCIQLGSAQIITPDSLALSVDDLNLTSICQSDSILIDFPIDELISIDAYDIFIPFGEVFSSSDTSAWVGPGNYQVVYNLGGCEGSFIFPVYPLDPMPLNVEDWSGSICSPLEAIEMEAFIEPNEGSQLTLILEAPTEDGWDGSSGEINLLNEITNESQSETFVLQSDTIIVEFGPIFQETHIELSFDAGTGDQFGYSIQLMLNDGTTFSYQDLNTGVLFSGYDNSSPPFLELGEWDVNGILDDSQFGNVYDFNTTFTPNEYDAYQLTWNSTICDSEYSQIVVFADIPIIEYEGETDITICQDSTLLLSVEVPTLGTNNVIEWNPGDDLVFSNEFNFMDVGTEEITVNTLNYCGSDSLEILVNVIECVDAIYDEKWHDILLFPNPFIEQISISQIPREVSQISIYDSNGKMIDKIMNPDIRIDINTAHWSQGLYCIRIEHPLGLESFKMIKN